MFDESEGGEGKWGGLRRCEGYEDFYRGVGLGVTCETRFKILMNSQE